MLFDNKKGEAVSIIILILLVIIMVGYGIKISGRECNSNTDCKETEYCGSDFKCHKLKTVTVYKHDLVIPAVIVAAALVVGAVILRKKKDKVENIQYDHQTDYQQPENPYYK